MRYIADLKRSVFEMKLKGKWTILKKSKKSRRMKMQSDHKIRFQNLFQWFVSKNRNYYRRFYGAKIRSTILIRLILPQSISVVAMGISNIGKFSLCTSVETSRCCPNWCLPIETRTLLPENSLTKLFKCADNSIPFFRYSWINWKFISRA